MAKAKKTIRITGAGIYGVPTAENPTGELPIGFEFETEGDVPAGWVGRAIVVGGEPAEGSQFVTGNDDDGDSAVAAARKEVIEKAEAEFKRLNEAHEDATRSLVARAERAEADLQQAHEQIEALNLKLARNQDGGAIVALAAAHGAENAASPEEIKAAVGLLDGKNADHWTAAGLPAVDAVAELTGKSVTRAAITEAAPDAKRPTD